MKSKTQSDYIQQCCHLYYVIQELAINVRYCKQHVLINGKADWSLLTSSSSPPLSLSVSFGQPITLQETSTNKSKQTIITITSSLLLLPFCQDNWGNSSISRTEATILFISKTKLYSPHHLVVVTASSSSREITKTKLHNSPNHAEEPQKGSNALKGAVPPSP